MVGHLLATRNPSAYIQTGPAGCYGMTRLILDKLFGRLPGFLTWAGMLERPGGKVSADLQMSTSYAQQYRPIINIRPS